MNEKSIHNEGITRRELIKVGAMGAAGLAAAKPGELLAKPAPKPAVAKSVIQIWLWGGPSHIDTFDPKPEAGEAYCGPLKSPVSTNVDGIRIGELLPELAKMADKYSIIRSMTHRNNGHETASYITQTGRLPGRLVYPCVGAVVSKFKGYDAGYKGLIPPYIVLTSPQGRFSEAGFLGPKYKPFATGGDPARNPFAVEGIVTQGITKERQKGRREFVKDLDLLGKANPKSAEFAAHEKAEDKAYDLILGDAGKLFDLSQESDEVRDRYGRNTFGQSCLMARRLVENGTPYITINYKGWDTHKKHFQSMNRKLPEMDMGMAALLSDLDERGLLGSTIVWWSGEFGRTPKIQWEAPWGGGRGHYGNCFSSVLAGGGFKGGHVIGASDERGEHPAERPVYPADLIGSVYEQMGIDPEGQLPNPRNLPLKVMPAESDDGSPRGGRLTEIV